MRESELTPEFLWELLDYNPDTGVLTWKERKTGSPYWKDSFVSMFNTKFAGKQAGVMVRYGGAKSPRRQLKIIGTPYRAYRLIWFMMTGKWPKAGIDHIDQDSTNDRWNNLREATDSENAKNLPKSKANTSGYVGIYWDKSAKKYRQKTQCNGVVYGSRHSDLQSAIEERERLLKELGFSPNHGRNRMNRHIDFDETNTVWTWIPDSQGFTFDRVKIQHAKSGDTDSSMLSLPNEMTSIRTQDQIIEVADAIGDKVNESFHEWGMFAFNCPEDRTHYLAADREVVASSGLFLGKKHYVMNVVDDEGQAVNKKKIMGIELKRSSASAFLKEVLNEIVDAILNWKSEDEIRDIFMYYKEDIINRDIREIAVPSSCKTLNKATDQYQNTGSMKDIHITAKSALKYNLRRNEEDPIINAGDKIYMTYIVDPDESIAFPVDEDPPQWLLDIPIDYTKMWERVDNAVSHYLVAMGWDFKSKKTAVRQNLFGF